MRRLVLLLIVVVGTACNSLVGNEPHQLSGSAGGTTGGVGGTGGATGGSGGHAVGGTTGTGGISGAGGTTGIGGTLGTGGKAGSGGAAGTTGTGGSGGAGGTKGTGGTVATGGTTGTGGTVATGGTTGTGGTVATGGTTGTGGTVATGGSPGTGGSPPKVIGPCDIYAGADAPATPCAAAYSTVRLLLGTYSGPLYQVRKGGSKAGWGGTTMNIGFIPGGFADAVSQDTFCGSATCTVSKLYDQSGKANDLTVAPAGCYTGGAGLMPDNESDATMHSTTLNGHKVYPLYMVPQDGYRNNSASGIPIAYGSQGIYEVADGTRTSGQCCWDFGNASTNNCNSGNMAAIFFEKNTFWGYGAGPGPWFMADFEAGVWAGGSGPSNVQNTSLPSSAVPFAFGTISTMSQGTTPQYSIKVGNAQSGSLTTAYDGPMPNRLTLSGGIVLGIHQDNENGAQGTFFEGAITSGRPTAATDALVFANVQAAGYGQ